MAKCFLLCLILVNAFVAMAENKPQHPPAPAYAPYKAEALTIRKLGKHQPEPKAVKTFAPTSSPSQAPQTGESLSTDHETVGANSEENVSVEGQTIIIDQQHKHHHSMESVAGGSVILGGLATTFLVAVFCYIRATGRHKSETHRTSSEINH